MSAEHQVAVPVPANATTSDVRRLLDYVDCHAPATAAVAATDGKIVATWTADPAEAPVRNTTTTVGFGPQPADPLAYGRSPGELR